MEQESSEGSDPVTTQNLLMVVDTVRERKWTRENAKTPRLVWVSSSTPDWREKNIPTWPGLVKCFFHRNDNKNAYLLFFLTVFGGTTVCDGTVIGERFVVTARHGCAEACPKECSRDWNKCAISLSCYVQLR